MVLAGCAPALWSAALDRVRVRAGASRSFRRVLAERELLRGLERLLPGKDVGLAGADFLPGAGDTLFELRTDAARFHARVLRHLAHGAEGDARGRG